MSQNLLVYAIALSFVSIQKPVADELWTIGSRFRRDSTGYVFTGQVITPNGQAKQMKFDCLSTPVAEGSFYTYSPTLTEISTNRRSGVSLPLADGTVDASLQGAYCWQLNYMAASLAPNCSIALQIQDHVAGNSVLGKMIRRVIPTCPVRFTEEQSAVHSLWRVSEVKITDPTSPYSTKSPGVYKLKLTNDKGISSSALLSCDSAVMRPLPRDRRINVRVLTPLVLADAGRKVVWQFQRPAGETLGEQDELRCLALAHSIRYAMDSNCVASLLVAGDRILALDLNRCPINMPKLDPEKYDRDMKDRLEVIEILRRNPHIPIL